MTKRTSQFRLNPIKTVALMALLVASAVTQGVLAAEYTVTRLGTLGGSHSYASGVNEFGQVVGNASTTKAVSRAFLSSGGTMTDLGTLGGDQSLVFGAAINAAGQVVGDVDTGPHTGFHAFLSSGGSMTDLGTLGGTKTFTAARSINDAGQVVGFSTTTDNAMHAFLSSGGTMTDLGTLGGTHSHAYGINAAGQVVGVSNMPGDGARHAFLYSGGRMTDLGTLGGTHSSAAAINAAGQIVGESETLSHGTHAFLYSGGTMTDLNDLVPAGVTVIYATGINAAGQIVGVGRIGNDPNSRALLLTPTLLNRFAYALVDVSTTGSDTPDSRYAYNAAGGAIRITQPGVGLYDVAFDELPAWGPGLSSAVAVTAYGSSPITCAVVGYDRAPPSRTVAHVGCFNAAEKLMADSRFTILVVGNQSLPVLSAFVMSGPSPGPEPNPAWSWTSGDHPITVTHNPAPGSYDVHLGLGNTPMSAKLVTGFWGGGTRCNYGIISGGLQVRCYDGTGAATDQGFSVVQVAGGRPGRRLGFAKADKPDMYHPYTPHPSMAFNSAGGAITATHSSVGQYAMHFAGLQQLPGRTEHVQVTALSGPLSTCNVVSWGNSTDGLTVVVECRNGAGQFMDSWYQVLVIE